MGQLENMQTFTRIVEAGSITKASEQLNLAKSAVSKRLGDLENKLGSKLINRTTRKSSLTEAGLLYYQRVKLILEDVDELDNQILTKIQTLEGSLKIAVPLSFGLTHLSPAIDAFVKEHSNLKVQVDFSDRRVNIIEEGFDLAFRIGQMEDSTMRAREIAPIKHVLCASPQYLHQHGGPKTPEQLKSHRVLKYGSSPLSGIHLWDKNNKEHVIHVSPHIIANNGDFLKSMAISGHGVVLLPTFIVSDALASKALERVLVDYSCTSMRAYAIYPATRHLPLKTRRLIDFFIDRFGDNPYWDQV